jgi:glyoxylase-like metal-dependent hydrolase (beta-lactamase superfamily II)
MKLKVTALVLVVIAIAAVAQVNRQEGELVVTPVRGSVHLMAMEPAGNVAASVGPDGAFIIDDQFAPMAPRLKAAVAKLTEKPLRYVLNTHWHGDHTGANATLGREGYVIVAHDNVRTRMSREFFSEFSQRTTPASPPEALPVITFSESMTFHFNGDVVRVIHVPRAHTDGDALYYFEKADVLHAGDVFVRYGYPFIDVASEGSIAGMIAGLDRILGIIGPETLVIPGHGKLARRADVEEFRGMLVTARSRVVERMQAGQSADQIVAAKPLADLEARWGQGFMKSDRFIRGIVASEGKP